MKRYQGILLLVSIISLILIGSFVLGDMGIFTQNFTNITPINNSYYGSGHQLNFTVNVSNFQGNGSYRLELWVNGTPSGSNASIQNSTIVQFQPNRTIPDGVNLSWYFNASNMTAGAVFYSNVSYTYYFTYDTVKPLIDYTSISAIGNYTNVSKVTVYVNITDTILRNGTYVLHKNGVYNASKVVNFETTYITTPISNSSTFNESGIVSNLADGNYSYYVNISDMANNSNSSIMRYIYVDATYPIVNISSQTTNNTNYTASPSFQINATYTEARFANATLYIFNSTGVINSTVNSTVQNNASIVLNASIVSEGNYTVNVTICDTAGNCNSTNNSFFTYDPNVPSAAITISDTSIYQLETVTLQCDGTDTMDWNPTEYIYVQAPGDADYSEVTNGAAYTHTDHIGNYSVKCVAIDDLGNSKTVYSTFYADYWPSTSGSSSGSSGGSGGSSSSSTTTTEEEEVVTEETEPAVEETSEIVENFQVVTGDIFNFGLSDVVGNINEHTLTIIDVNVEQNFVLLQLESDPVQVTLYVGEAQEVDLDADGVNDVKVTLNSIQEGVADVDIGTLTEGVTILSSTELEEQTKSSKAYIWVIGVVLLLVAAGVIFYFVFKGSSSSKTKRR